MAKLLSFGASATVCASSAAENVDLPLVAGRTDVADLFRLTFDPAAVVLDEVAAIRQFPDAGSGSGVERVVGQFFQNQTAQLGLGHASLLLQSLDGAEACPVGPLKFQISSWRLTC